MNARRSARSRPPRPRACDRRRGARATVTKAATAPVVATWWLGLESGEGPDGEGVEQILDGEGRREGRIDHGDRGRRRCARSAAAGAGSACSPAAACRGRGRRPASAGGSRGTDSARRPSRIPASTIGTSSGQASWATRVRRRGLDDRAVIGARLDRAGGRDDADVPAAGGRGGSHGTGSHDADDGHHRRGHERHRGPARWRCCTPGPAASVGASSQSAASSVKRRHHRPGRGPYGVRALSPR